MYNEILSYIFHNDANAIVYNGNTRLQVVSRIPMFENPRIDPEVMKWVEVASPEFELVFYSRNTPDCPQVENCYEVGSVEWVCDELFNRSAEQASEIKPCEIRLKGEVDPDGVYSCSISSDDPYITKLAEASRWNFQNLTIEQNLDYFLHASEGRSIRSCDHGEFLELYLPGLGVYAIRYQEDY